VKRFFELDAARGIAVVAMVAFHALYDLNYFRGYGFGIYSGAFFALGRFAALAFIFIVGISLTLSYSRAEQGKTMLQLLKKFLLRGAGIFCLGLAITVFTLLFFPRSPILFGVLHFIGIAVILSFPFVRKPKASLFCGAIMLALGLWLSPLRFDFPWLFWLGLAPENFFTFDYFPLLPWLGVALFGIFAGNLFYPGGKRRFNIPNAGGFAPVRLLCFLGRHSLLVYFLHQPLLVALIFSLA